MIIYKIYTPGKKELRFVTQVLYGLRQAVTWETAPQTKEETLELLKQTPALYRSYQGLSKNWKERFLDFCIGKKSLPFTYDPFFKYLFDPEIHGDRLSRFVSSLLGFEVKILRVLPGEDRMIDGESCLIMDLLAETTEGALCNVEIQKQGYAFPAERISCYSADLVMRQYMRVRGQAEKFSYRDIKKVYVIVLFEKSTNVFHQHSASYLHYGKTCFDTGLKLELLQEFCLIALDVFREISYSEDEKSEQKAWLSLLTTENLEDAERQIRNYPWLEEIYREIATLRQRPEEVLGMWSEALRILDENTLKYYVEELEEKLRKVTEEKDAKLQKVAEEKDAELQKVTEEKDAELQKVAEEKDAELQKVTEEKDAEIAALKQLLKEQAERNR